jgi:hypothetical protein
VFGAHFVEQGLYQVRDVFFMLAQRRHVDVEDVETVVKVVAEFARVRLLRNLVCRRENADIYRGFDFASQTAEVFCLLKRAAALPVLPRHFADFVQQERSSLG